MVRLITGRKHIFFKETIINIPSENLPKLSKERLQYLCNAVKLTLFGERKELVGSGKSQHSVNASNLFDGKVPQTQEDYKFSTTHNPLFNSTHVCKVEDHWQGHRCNRVNTKLL